MTVTFAGTSKTNLIIRPIEPERYVPLQNMKQLMQGWIPYQETKQHNSEKVRNVHCVLGSNLMDTPQTTTALPTYSGVIGTILTAYNLHQNLVLRPDDIFIMILAQFSTYINGEGRAEELRTKFVKHKGQLELGVLAGGTACNAPYDVMTRTFLDGIATKLVDPTLKNWFLPGFSTTTYKDEVVASAAAMCSFQAYFTYTYSLICGIPQITLEGTVEDWELLREKVKPLTDFDDEEKTMSEQWVPLLRKVLDNFVETARQNDVQDFWDQIVSYYYQDNVCAKETHLSGWLSVFTFFDGQGQIGVTLDQPVWPRIKLDSINHNVVSCPVKIDDNGLDYNATLYVGSMAFDYEPLFGLEYDNFPVAVQTPENQEATLHNLIPRTDWAMTVWERQKGNDDDNRGSSDVSTTTSGLGDLFRPENFIKDAVHRSLNPGEQCQADDPTINSNAGPQPAMPDDTTTTTEATSTTTSSNDGAQPSMPAETTAAAGAARDEAEDKDIEYINEPASTIFTATAGSSVSGAAASSRTCDRSNQRQIWLLVMTMSCVWMLSWAT